MPEKKSIPKTETPEPEKKTGVGKRGPDQKPRKQRSDRQPKLVPGDNAKYMSHSLRLMKLSPVDMTDTSQVEKRITEYFTICGEDDYKPSFAGLAVAFGIDRRRLWEYSTGNCLPQRKNPEVMDAIKKAVAVLNGQMEDWMQSGKINPVSGIFLMKNNYGYKDQTEKVIIPAAPLGEAPDQAALADKYRAQVIETDDFVEMTNDVDETNLD